LQDLKVSLNEPVILAGFTKGSAQWHQHHHLGRADVCVPAAWVDALIPGLSFLLANSQALFFSGPRNPEMHQFACASMLASIAYQNAAISGQLHEETAAWCAGGDDIQRVCTLCR
jgi:hypothetical protein